MDPDYFTASGHKWFYSPKGTAVLYVRDELKLDVVPTVIASEFQLNTFHSNFDYVSKYFDLPFFFFLFFLFYPF